MSTETPPPHIDLVEDPDEREEWHVIRHDGEDVAIADVQETGDAMWIHDIVVHPDYRGRGYGSALLRSVIARHGQGAIALSCEAVVTSFPGVRNTAGLTDDELTGWYGRHGFQPDPYAPDYEHRLLRLPPTTL
ncbi:GNAT family N-acetyltransferase (plasmid) [Actinacidiphila glaucinigra]|uniref:GNAT family N-acetyltransferase n=1 Tax=Actinacidiphila glaucinigra TaxID=235986 RepID=UPI002DD978DD|nr:GNAT family N-acetyltransferase [Actinacidiphila glaucinigra]WSD65769.1 GNAT family N-acetyltransferase [Actinacidiphila glaucinigra]WSD65943.1 GNAT family N-acetyltransferase [Actinacidiphila glaucinigra]